MSVVTRQQPLSQELTAAIRSPWSFYSNGRRIVFLAILFLTSTSQFFDRNVISVLLEPIKEEFGASDKMLGLLGGLCFTLFYAIAGMPIARWADSGDRRTIIALALTIWSGMTMLSGLAQTFWQLALARIGVGAGEAGCLPTAQSLIADYFPPGSRTLAIGIFSAGIFLGNMLGLGLGGYIAATHGWRSTLLFGGASGFILAVFARLILGEPRQSLASQLVTPRRESVYEALRVLFQKASYRWLLVASLLYSFASYGIWNFIPSFLLRVVHVSLVDVSVNYGLAAGIGSLFGAIGGGWLADRVSRYDIRWLSWIAASTFFLTGDLFIVAFSTREFRVFLTLAFLAHLLWSAGAPPMYAAIHAVCGKYRRATAVALVYFSASLFGGLGPMFSGAISDALTPIHGSIGLGVALISMAALLIVSGFVFLVSGFAMPNDLEQ